jgi:hypothetical protein
MRIEDLKGFISFPNGFQLLSDQPLDARYCGEDLEFLQSIIDIGAAYPGLKVFIISENKSYIYRKDSTGNYKFEVESIEFTEEEKLALSSGITKDKVKQFESKYSLPRTGIPESDLSSDIKDKLKKIDDAVTVETDPTVPAWAKSKDKPSYSLSEIQGLPEALGDKVSKVEGKGLSDENYTYGEKFKLRDIAPGAQVNLIEEIYINGDRLAPNDKTINIVLKTVNGGKLVESGNLELVDINKDQNIGGYKTFKNPPLVPAKTDINLENPRATSIATEAQIARAIASLGGPLTKNSPLDAKKLVGEIPDSVIFPILNQDTTGKSGSAVKLSTPRKISLSGKVESEKIEFDGTKDIEIPIIKLSTNPADYPVFNQDTTGRAGSAGRLSTPIGLKVNLGREEEVKFDGSTDLDEIPVYGRLKFKNLPQGSGDGYRRKVVASTFGVKEADLDLVELEPKDVGLDKVINKEQATKEDLEELKIKLERISNMGNFLGSYETFDELPRNSSEIESKFGKTPRINDFVTVRGGEYPKDSSIVIPDGSATCWSIVDISDTGDLTWAYEYTYDFDLTGKIDKITGESILGKFPIIKADGSLASSGVSKEDLLLISSKINGGITYKEKIERALMSGDTIEGARKLIHPGTSDPCTHGGEQTPVYFENGTPWPSSKVPSLSINGIGNRVVRLGYTEDINNPGKYLPDGTENDDISVKYSDEANVATSAKKFITEEGNPASTGNNIHPIYLDEEGKPRAIKSNLGDLAYLNVEVESGLEGSVLGDFEITYNPGEDPSDLFNIKFIPKKDTYSPVSYGLILPEDLGEDKVLALKVGLASKYIGQDFTIDQFLNLSNPEQNSADGSYTYSIDFTTHKKKKIPKVRVFELKNLSFYEVESGLEIDSEQLTINENLGMSYLRLGKDIDEIGINVYINTNSRAYYNESSRRSQGIYLVEISE